MSESLDTNDPHRSAATHPAGEPPAGAGLAGYLDVLWRARWLVVVGSVIAAVASWVVSSQLPRKYEATATVMVSPPKVGQAAAGAVVGLEVRNYRAYLENQSLSAEVVRQYKLDGAPHGLSPERFLADALAVTDVRDSRLLSVSVTLRDPKLAADVANDLAQRAVELSRTVNQEEVVIARDIIKEQLDVARDRLTEARTAYEHGQQSAQLELLEREVDTLLAQQNELRLVQVSIERERARLAKGEEELARHERVRDVRRAVGVLSAPAEAPRPAADERPRPTMQERREAASKDKQAQPPGEAPTPRREWSKPSERPEPRSPVREEPSTEPAFSIRDNLLDPYVNPVYEYLNQQVAANRAQLASLESERDALLRILRGKGGKFPVLADLYQRQAEVDELRMQQELAEKIYLDVATRYEAARLQVAERSAQLQLVDRALPPERPVSPRVTRTVAATAVLAPSVLVTALVLLEALRRVMTLRAV